MFKQGMKLKAIGDYVSHGSGYDHAAGDIIIVKAIYNETGLYHLLNTNNNKEVMWAFYGEDYFTIYKEYDAPKNDIEWLDRVKENFKYG